MAEETVEGSEPDAAVWLLACGWRAGGCSREARVAAPVPFHAPSEALLDQNLPAGKEEAARRLAFRGNPAELGHEVGRCEYPCDRVSPTAWLTETGDSGKRVKNTLYRASSSLHS